MDITECGSRIPKHGLDRLLKNLKDCDLEGVHYTNNSKRSLKDDNFATLIYDSITNEVTVIHNKPVFLSPQFNGKTLLLPGLIIYLDSQSTDLSSIKPDIGRSALTTAFGSVKRQRMMRERERNAEQRAFVDEASAINRAMDGQQRLKKESSNDVVDNTTKSLSERERLLPAFNLNTTDVDDIYPIDRLFPSRLLTALSGSVNALCQSLTSGIHQLDSTYPSFLTNRLRALPINAWSASVSKLSKTSRPTKSVYCLVLVSHMVKLLQLSARDLQRKQPLPDTPAVVSKFLLTDFTCHVQNPGGGSSSRTKIRSLSPFLRDRLIYWMLILLLHSDGFTTYIDDLPQDLRMRSDKLKSYLVYVGCKVTKENTKVEEGQSQRTVAILKAPVKFPDTVKRT